MGVRNKTVSAFLLAALASTSQYVNAQGLNFPDWPSFIAADGSIHQNPGDGVSVHIVSEPYLAGSGIEPTARAPHIRRVVTNGQTVSRRIWLENASRPMRIHKKDDIGNSYILLKQYDNALEHVYVAVEHFNYSGNTTTIEVELNREIARSVTAENITRIASRELAGDIKAMITLVQGTPRRFRLKRRISGVWRTGASASFGASGCASDGKLFRVCIKNVAPLIAPVDGQLTNARIDMALNVAALVNRHARYASVAVRTPRDTANSLLATNE